MLSRRIASAPASSASRDLAEGVRLDLYREAGSARASGDGRGHASREREVVVLDEEPSSRPKRWFVAAAGGTACFSSARNPGRRLARVEDRRSGSVDRIDVPSGEGRDPREPAERD